MFTPIPRGLVRTSLTVLSVLLGAITSHAGPMTEITSCDQQLIEGKAILVTDLDCTSVYPQGVTIARGTLYLNGHTLVTSGQTAIQCQDDCTIVGPGTITGDGNGIFGRKKVRVRDVDFSVTVAAAGSASVPGEKLKGQISVERVSITGGIFGVYADRKVRILDSTIAISGGVGVSVGQPGPFTGEPCSPGKRAAPRLIRHRQCDVVSVRVELCGHRLVRQTSDDQEGIVVRDELSGRDGCAMHELGGMLRGVSLQS